MGCRGIVICCVVLCSDCTRNSFVMVILKGSVPISFEGNKEAAAYAEIVSMGGINSEVKKKLIYDIGTILQSNLSIPRTRFFLKVFDTTLFRTKSNL
ncbi:uncharacterized protein HKW66_Vig0248500 [Vigna angularis]|uniref:Macrophage migration inhibitory factor n=1 Tax=Phaseolus angularis TaxID=3914 RepID=A0A8T0JQW5_PHAAN|nr:uncharacterized protein HKW66_Vig0248500 [Vigna angularis]